MKTGSVKGVKLLKSALTFALCYIAFMLFVLLMIVINNPQGWREYFIEDYSRFLSLCVCVLLLFYIVFYYFYFEDKEFLSQAKNAFLIFSLMTVSVLICYLMGRFVSVFARPMALMALLALFLFNRRQAILLNFVFSLLIFVIDTYTDNFASSGAGLAALPGMAESGVQAEVYFSLMLGFVCGTFAVLTAGNVKTRGGMLLLGTFVSIPTVVVILLLELPAFNILAKSNWIAYIASAGYGILGCFLSSALTLCFLPLLEFVFNRLTVFRLRELTSANVPLIKRLRTEAPGTFNHSLIVAQLAESCAIAIGENAELARAAAYYHDVGKLKQPDCFTENQSDYNIHDELTPELSADIIRSHATDGYELLMAARLPKEIADVAREHHGTLPIKFFYDKAMRLSGGDANIKDYSYLGPTPHSKTAAIIMIADASEAAARTLRERTPENVERMVRSVIEERMDLDQFVDCDITMRELTTIKETIVDALSGVHHHRVKYPSIRFNRAKEVVKEEPGESDEK